MRIRHIYITKEGEPMANPEMEYPKREDLYDYDPVDKLHSVDKYHSGLLPFEDKDRAKWHILQQNRDIVIFGQARDTLIPVDIEVEVVDVFTKEEMLKIAQGDGFGVSSAYVPSKNRVLRIKP